MKNIVTITKQTLQEALSKKVFITFFIISTVVLAIFIFLAITLGLDQIQGFVRDEGGEIINLRERIVTGIRVAISGTLFIIGLFISIFAVSGFIPDMQERGNIDLLLSKPIARYELILGKYFGGIIIVFLNIAYVTMGIWLLLGLKFDAWSGYFLLTILTTTFTFAIWYSMEILVGLFTRSSFLAIIICLVFFYVLAPILESRVQWLPFFESSILDSISTGLYYFLPLSSQFANITTELSQGKDLTYTHPIWFGFLFLSLNIGASILYFRKKDY